MPSGIYIRTEEHKRNIGLAHKGMKHTEESKRLIGLIHLGNKYNLGKHLSEETKKKISNAHKGKPSWNKGLTGINMGDKNPNWKGGIKKSKDYAKICYHRDIEKSRDYHRKWRKEHRLSIKMYDHRRRLQEKGLSIKTIQLVYEDNIKQYGTLTCLYCLKPIEFGADTLEHKTPLSRGGTNEYNNLAVACKSCNYGKKNKTVEEYKEWLSK